MFDYSVPQTASASEAGGECSVCVWAQKHTDRAAVTSEPHHSSRFSLQGFAPNTAAEWRNSGIVQHSGIHSNKQESTTQRQHSEERAREGRVSLIHRQGHEQNLKPSERTEDGVKTKWGRGHGGQRQLHQSAGVQWGADTWREQAHPPTQRRYFVCLWYRLTQWSTFTLYLKT